MPWNLADAARRYEAGESLTQIARALDTPETTVYRRLLAGGLPPREVAPWGARRQGNRNYAPERARHPALAPEKQRAIYDLLRAQLPERELALVGRDRILAWLHGLGLRRPNGGPVSWTMVLRWTRHHGFPLLHGTANRRYRTPALTTTYAATAWALSGSTPASETSSGSSQPLSLSALGEAAPHLTLRECCSTVALRCRSAVGASRALRLPNPRQLPRFQWHRTMVVRPDGLRESGF